MAHRVVARGAPHERSREAASKGLELDLGAVAEQVGDYGPVDGVEGAVVSNHEPGLERRRMRGELELAAGLEPVHELGDGLEATHPEDLLELRQRVEVLRTRRARGQRTARRKVVNTETRLQVVQEKAHLGLRPHPHYSHSQPPIGTGPADLVELGRKVGALEVVEVEGVDDALVRSGVLVHAKDQPRPARSSDAVCTELG